MKTYKGNPFDKPQNGNDFYSRCYHKYGILTTKINYDMKELLTGKNKEKTTFIENWNNNKYWGLFSFTVGIGIYAYIFEPYEARYHWPLVFIAIGTIILPLAAYISLKKKNKNR